MNYASSSLEVPYTHSTGENPFVEITTAIAKRCGSRTLSASVGEVGSHLKDVSESKHVVNLSMPPLEGTAGYRKQLMAEHGTSSVHCMLNALLITI
jgi:hypothetical protein